MKVTKRGKNPDKNPFIGTCFNCKTEIECVKSETKYHPAPYPCVDQRETDWRSVTCPECGRDIVVRMKED